MKKRLDSFANDRILGNSGDLIEAFWCLDKVDFGYNLTETNYHCFLRRKSKTGHFAWLEIDIDHVRQFIWEYVQGKRYSGRGALVTFERGMGDRSTEIMMFNASLKDVKYQGQ